MSYSKIFLNNLIDWYINLFKMYKNSYMECFCESSHQKHAFSVIAYN